MTKNVNWDGVFQSIIDTWLPLFGTIILIVVVGIIIHIYKKRKCR